LVQLGGHQSKSSSTNFVDAWYKLKQGTQVEKNIDTTKEEIICIEKQKIEIELRKEAREQKKEEREIMMMDTRHLSPIQLEYFQCLQMEIMQKRMTK
jgi:hypothetical protein